QALDFSAIADKTAYDNIGWPEQPQNT
ncbi:TPA: tail fiber assembly protein, partial [Escherichia coli]|nr:tail fiber assembly protein [Escherichia coli]HAJ7165377.1 tail fiber assembly protein [Escherichia coli]HAJ7170613.1 tail fiber assembly protein [Escherichia coli]HAJ7199948.1 tail fiber assembly protein [Escherichia coli]